MIAVILVQAACVTALWYFAGPWAVAFWATYVCAPAIAWRLLR